MEKEYKFSNITDKQLKQVGVQALADRPNAPQQYGMSNLSPAQLKLWFDKLATLIAGKLNELQDAITGEDAAKYITLALEDYKSLHALIEGMQDGSFSAKVLQLFPNENAQIVAPLQDIIFGIAQSFSENKEELKKLDEDKLDKVIATADYRRVYGVTKSGEQEIINISEAPAERAVPAYSQNGNLKTNMPSSPADAVPLGYIEEMQRHMGAGVEFVMDPETFIVTIKVVNPWKEVIYTTTLDLPLESVVVSGDYADGVITLVLQSGQKIEIPVSKMVNGLVTQAAHDADVKALEDKLEAALGEYINEIYELVGDDYEDYS